MQWLLVRLLLVGQLVLTWVGHRDSQRAEYRADELGARAGGSDAAASLTDALAGLVLVELVVRRTARNGGGAADWRAAVEQSRVANAARVPLLRQLTLRDEVSLFSTHPPAGLRVRMIESRPSTPPGVTLTKDEAGRIDEELRRHYERARKHVAWVG